MRKTLQYLGGLTAAALFAATTGCETITNTSMNAPGALPRNVDGDVQPKITASTFLAHGELLERQGNFKQAADQYRRVLELTPDSVAARNRLGVTLNKLGKHNEATEQFRIALTRTPDASYIENNLGFSLYLEGKYSEARDVLAQCCDHAPGFTRARMNYGLALAQLGDFDKAREQFAAASNEIDAYYNIAMIQAEKGNYGGAAQSLESALRIDPKFEPAREQLRTIARLAAGAETSPVANGTGQNPGVVAGMTTTAAPAAESATGTSNSTSVQILTPVGSGPAKPPVASSPVSNPSPVPTTPANTSDDATNGSSSVSVTTLPPSDPKTPSNPPAHDLPPATPSSETAPPVQPPADNPAQESDSPDEESDQSKEDKDCD